MVADQKNSEVSEFIEEISEKGLDLSYQIFITVNESEQFPDTTTEQKEDIMPEL